MPIQGIIWNNLQGGGGGGGSGVNSVTGAVPITSTGGTDPVIGLGPTSQALIVSLQSLATFTNTAGTQLIGSTLDAFSLNWTYNRNSDNPASQTIDNGVGAVAVGLRTYAFTTAGLTATTTYTISAVGDDANYGAPVGNPSSLQTTINFRNLRYWGPSSDDLLTGANVVASSLSTEFITGKTVSKSFNGGAGTPPNWFYYAYPSSFGAPTTMTFNGLSFSDVEYSNGTTWQASPATVSLTNTAGYAENYYIIRTVNQYSSGTWTWAITS